MKGYGLTFIIAVATILAAVVFLATVSGSLWYAPDTEVPVPEQAKEFKAREVLLGDHPVRLRIPALQIDTHVQEVGVNALGNMASPSNFTDVGWYKLGPPPGLVGSAVITGHVDNALALDGVFKHLNEIRIDDDIFVDKKDGGTLNFKVTEIQKYPYTRVPLKTLFSRDDVPRLNLITCGGVWLPGAHSYDERLIIYTELVQ